MAASDAHAKVKSINQLEVIIKLYMINEELCIKTKKGLIIVARNKVRWEG